MARTVIADSGVLVALVRRDDQFHVWASAQTTQFFPPWHACDAVLSEAFFVAGQGVRSKLMEMLRRRIVVCSFNLDQELEPVLDLMDKYSNLPRDCVKSLPVWQARR
jgi:uncharacterized protein